MTHNDLGHFDKPISAGMVFTCEPGIYIPEENLGIRLEDDLVIQESEWTHFNLMRNIPLEADEIETLMNEVIIDLLNYNIKESGKNCY